MNEMDNKQRLELPHQQMAELPVDRRLAGASEVNVGYSEEQARAEAQRCLQCKRPPCVAGCPVDIDIPAFIKLISEGRYADAALKIKETNSFPAICGRVCPQEQQCQAKCVVGRTGRPPVGIGHLERFVGDYLVANPQPVSSSPEPTGYKVAIVGSGPAGLTTAGELAKLGHEVTIFEALHEPGGVMTYGIPEFRLPKDIIRYEIKALLELGVQIVHDTIIGRTLTIDELFGEMGFAAVFLGLGAGNPRFLGIEGENLRGVYSANEFLTRINLMRAYRDDYDTPIRRGNNVTVVGGGNVTLDSSRWALRLGAETVTIVYRRSREEMPARVEEVRHTEEEGVQFRFLSQPMRLLGDDGDVAAMECLQMELGEPDESGRARPIPIEGSEFTLPTDLVIIAIGARVSPLVPIAVPGIELGEGGHVIVNPDTLETSIPGVFGGGDLIPGEETIVRAMGDGRRAAQSIHKYLIDRE